MKEILKKLLLTGMICILSVSIISCSKTTDESESDEISETSQTKENTEKEDIEKEDIGNVGEDGMIKVTFDGSNIRNDIVEYMRSMAMIEWTPSENFSLNGDHNTWGVDLNFKQGSAYRGLPYTRAFSDLDGFAKYVENGVYTGPCGDYNTMPGNNCSSSCDVSWRRYLISTTEATYTYVPGYGNETIVPVGDYKYPDSNRDTAAVIAANPQEAIFEAYALCKPADAVVKWLDSRAAGHARMVAADAVVVRNNQGKINGGRSYLTVVEQTNKLTTSDGKQTTWLVDKIYTFTELYQDSYVPVTPVVFANGETETPYITLTDANTSENIVSSLNGTVESNYRMSAIEMTVNDENGKSVLSYNVELENGVSKVNLRKYTFNLDIKSLPEGKYTYTLTVHTPCLGSAKLQELSFEK